MVREHARHDREQARTITGRHFDAPLGHGSSAKTDTLASPARATAPAMRLAARCRRASWRGGTRGRVLDPFGHVLVAPDDAHRLGPAALDQVAGLEAGHVGLVEQVHDQLVELVEPLALPWRQVTERQRQQVERPRPLRVARGGSRSGTTRSFLEPVELARRRTQQAGVADEQRDLLLRCGAEIEPVHDAPRELRPASPRRRCRG